jgi:YidC/Oxa1 family membrane protein insertase
MNSRKILIYIALGMVSWLLVSAWQDFYQNKNTDNTTSGIVSTTVDLPKPINHSSVITFKNKDLTVSIDRMGAKIVEANLNQYNLTKKSAEKVHIFTKDNTHPFYASSGFSGDAQLLYQVKKKTGSALVLEATHEGVVYQKVFTLTPDYQIKVDSSVMNKGVKNWYGRGYVDFTAAKVTTLGPKDKKPEPNDFVAGESAVNQKSGLLGFNTYTGAAYYTSEAPYSKLTYEEVATTGINKRVKDSWLAIQKRYFLGAVIPPKGQSYDLVSQWKSGTSPQSKSEYVEQLKLQLIAAPQTLAPNEEAHFNSVVYAGPEVRSILSEISPGLDKTIDYGFLWFISIAIFFLMDHVNLLVHNWGLTIILSTALIRLLFFKLQESGNESIERMKKIGPQVEALNAQYANDPEAKNAAILALYKKEKVNPIGGCLPMLIQIPFYIATYHVVMEAVQLRHQSFLWINDLSATDPYYVMPLLLGLAIYLQTRMTPSSSDPMQENMKLVFPFILVMVSMSMPAGVSLYIFTSTVLGVAQQQLTSNRLKS